ncbi:UNVERIFIED_CONTAM: movement protein [Sesamum calycinum]|uniref:Movement protein n=1 Tax=Sesamum calycinum TaxID=2727403 RepID=A0AAW2IV28_9LAMI
MDLQASQNNYNKGDRLQTSESLSGFFSRMTVSNKTMERIMHQDSNLSPYDRFRIGGIGKVLNHIRISQRKHHIIYKVSSGEFAIPMEFTGSVMEMQLILKEKILEELSRLREEIAVTMKWIHIGTIEVVIKTTFKEGIDSEIHLSIMDRRINNLRDGCLGTMIGSGICTAKPGVFPKEVREALPVIAGRDFSQKILILNTGIREAKIMIGGAFGTPWFRGLIDSDNFYEESEEEIKNLKEALHELKTLDISEESKLSLENVKRLIQRNFSENPLAWWDRNKIEATLKIKEECKYVYVQYKPIQMNMEDKMDMQIIIKEHINLGLIKPGISTYSSPRFLEHIVEKVCNFPDVLKDKKHLQSCLGVVSFAGIFIKDFAKYRKNFRPLLKETESAKWKWEEIHTQRVRELKQVCNNLPKLAIPQDEDELVVYTDANDYRWADVPMKKTTAGEEPYRYTGGLFTK